MYAGATVLTGGVMSSVSTATDVPVTAEVKMAAGYTGRYSPHNTHQLSVE
jgi:hypothetical protein